MEEIRRSPPARWALFSYKWGYNPYKWPYKWVTEVMGPYLSEL